jgi:hypothetical protein
LPAGSLARFRDAIERLAATGLTDAEQHRILSVMAALLADRDWQWAERLIAASPLAEHPRAAARAAERALGVGRSTTGKVHAGRRVLADLAAVALGCERRGRGLTSEYRLPADIRPRVGHPPSATPTRPPSPGRTARR